MAANMSITLILISVKLKTIPEIVSLIPVDLENVNLVKLMKYTFFEYPNESTTLFTKGLNWFGYTGRFSMPVIC